MAKQKRKIRVMVKGYVEEVSAVDAPAAEGARAVLAKRAPLGKKVAMTTVADGHVHTLYLGNEDSGPSVSGSTSYDSTDEGQGHSHSWIRNAAGEVVIGEALGHTHEIAVMSKRSFSADERKDDAKSGAAMPDGSFPIETAADLKNAMQAIGRAKNRAAVEAHIRRRAKALGISLEGSFLSKSSEPAPAGSTGSTQAGEPEPQENPMDPKQIEALQKRAERAEKLATLTDAEKAVLNSRDAAGQETFLNQSPAERKAEVDRVAKAAAEKNPVVYKDLEGSEYRENDDPRLIRMAKRADADRLDAQERAKEAQKTRVESLAKSLSHLPGDDEKRTLLVEAVESLPLAKRADGHAALKALDSAFAQGFEKVGARGTPKPEPKGALAKIEALAKSIKDKNPKLTDVEAEVQALNTPEGQKLYGDYLQEQHAPPARVAAE